MASNRKRPDHEAYSASVSPTNSKMMTERERELARKNMKPMERSTPLPKKIEASESAFGITFSRGPMQSLTEEDCEIEVLKTILNREAYLDRLLKIVRTVSRKFKPEVADSVELVRVATLDVVDAIVRWREAKVSTVHH
jgi:hypothetical protein